jgi:toluene monooxygenase electron transfer component
MSNIAGGARWEFQVKRTPAGAGTAALFERLALGDSVAIDGPYGMAYLRTGAARDIVCIAGGSGLAPVISIARGVAADPEMGLVKVHVFYGGRGARDICGEDMLRALPGFGERFFYHPIISMPGEADQKDWSGKVGFVHELARDTIGLDLPAHEIYFAGPPPMAQAVQRMLVEAGVPGGQVHFDAFY